MEFFFSFEKVNSSCANYYPNVYFILIESNFNRLSHSEIYKQSSLISIFILILHFKYTPSFEHFTLLKQNFDLLFG